MKKSLFATTLFLGSALLLAGCKPVYVSSSAGNGNAASQQPGSTDVQATPAGTQSRYLITLESRSPEKGMNSAAAIVVMVDESKATHVPVGLNGHDWVISLTEYADEYSVEVTSLNVTQAQIPRVLKTTETRFGLDGTIFKIARKDAEDKPVAQLSTWNSQQNLWQESINL